MADSLEPGAHYVLVFRVDGSLYALPGGLVDHVSERARIVPVPTAPPCFAGVVHERGRVLAVVDLARIFGAGGERAPEGYRRLVVATLGGRPVVLLAHEVLGLREVAADVVRPAARGDALVAGELVDARGVVTLLDPDELLHRLRPGAESRHAS
ncbi:MAG TPA: chemotaxis protein CheW [Kofleriaceae bacterium]|nr:chemotaxis protein CheW [Kofleriaceae bacterium]